jgi:Flp pilus assembly protein TadB
MAGKELDPQRARAARDVVRQHPAMALFVALPALGVVALVWWLAGPSWAVTVLIAAALSGVWQLLRKR